jgi:hypothetical protein
MEGDYLDSHHGTSVVDMPIGVQMDLLKSTARLKQRSSKLELEA